MKITTWPLAVTLLVSALAIVCADAQRDDQPQDSQESVEQLRKVVSALARQVMLQQLAAEERSRADGGSGIKQIRVRGVGPRPYFSNSHTGSSMGAIHDHSNRPNMLGQGEMQFVLNGVEFRTRHNDYLLRMPSTKSTTYNVVEDLPFPDVPPEVKAKATVQEQIDEMRLWFKAWKDQDATARDYRPYFRPALCYLEGAWTTKVSEEVEEPFFSDRHALDAETWFDLHEKVRFTSYTGSKSVDENFAFLPTTLINITEKGEPVYAQWNYRILCHPLSEDLPTSYLKAVDDLGPRLAKRKELGEWVNTRSARFQVVSPKDRSKGATHLDRLMEEVPGRDNYPADLTSSAFGLNMLDPDSHNKSLLNVGYYHSRYRIEKRDAMGLTGSRRGFSDPNVFMAETTHPRIAGMYLRRCRGKKSKRVCGEALKRMTYAIPLEIVYLTPLTKWNPFEIQTYEKKNEKVVTENGKRTGKFTKDLAYNGTHRHGLYYRTPTEFFTGGEIQSDPADTVKGSVGVLDQAGNVRRVSSSGIRIFLPDIPGVGVIRQRYPIVPVHGEDSAVWKELNALKDVVTKINTNAKYLLEKPAVGQAPKGQRPPRKNKNKRPRPTTETRLPDPDATFTFTLMTTNRQPPGQHSHTVEFTVSELRRMRQGETLDTFTSQDNGHSHAVSVRFSKGRLRLVSCDNGNMPCWDGHTSCLMAPSETSCSAARLNLNALLANANPK